jgi:hypothetical protein
MLNVSWPVHRTQAGIHVGLIRLDRGSVTTQGRKGSHTGQRPKQQKLRRGSNAGSGTA